MKTKIKELLIIAISLLVSMSLTKCIFGYILNESDPARWGWFARLISIPFAIIALFWIRDGIIELLTPPSNNR